MVPNGDTNTGTVLAGVAVRVGVRVAVAVGGTGVGVRVGVRVAVAVGGTSVGVRVAVAVDGRGVFVTVGNTTANAPVLLICDEPLA